MKWALSDIQKWTGGQIVSEVKKEFNEFGTDTRKNLKDQIFVALKGEQFDAHDYLEKAIEQGAAALLVHQWPDHLKKYEKQVTVIKVEDTLVAFQKWAQGYRRSMKAHFIGITGSNGKTTTKEFTAQIISAYKKTFYSQGSFNNHWGVPITLLTAPQDSEVVVVEMGMNHRGEIQKLVELAEPTVVVCTTVGTAHIEFFGSQKKIAEEKQDIYLYSNEIAVRVFNQDNEFTFDMMYPSAKKFPAGRMLSFSGKNDKADVYFKIEDLDLKTMTLSGVVAGVRGSAVVQVFGEQNLTNLMAASTLAYAIGLKPEQIWQALSRCQTSWGRNQFISTTSGAQILFDGYNANPDSFAALFANMKLVQKARQKIAVIGQMKELGDHASQAHFDLAQLAARSGFTTIVFFGENHLDFSKGLKEANFAGQSWVQAQFDEVQLKKVADTLQKEDMVVVKGSRGAQTERFVSLCQPIDWSLKK